MCTSIVYVLIFAMELIPYDVCMWHCGHSLFNTGNTSTIYIRSAVVVAAAAVAATIVVVYSCRNFSFR